MNPTSVSIVSTSAQGTGRGDSRNCAQLLRNARFSRCEYLEKLAVSLTNLEERMCSPDSGSYYVIHSYYRLVVSRVLIDPAHFPKFRYLVVPDPLMSQHRRGAYRGTNSNEVTMKNKDYTSELTNLEAELAKLQGWVVNQGLRVAVIFEGRDAAGKGGTIKTITRRLNSRVVRTVALPTPTERQKTEWFLQRYVPHLPAGGEMVLFDRSWYNRLGVEKVMGFSTEAEYERFLVVAPVFEQELVQDGIILIKYWLHVSDDEQERRFQRRNTDPRRRWKLSPMDLESRARWVEYSRARDVMLEHTNTEWAPWVIADMNDKKSGRLSIVRHLLDQIPYQDMTPPPLELPDRQPQGDYETPDWSHLSMPAKYLS